MKTKYTVVWNVNNMQVKHLKDKTTQCIIEITEIMFSSSRNMILLFNSNFEEEYFAHKHPCMHGDWFLYSFTIPDHPFATVLFVQSGFF